MKTKKYKSKEKPLPRVEEPVATYGSTVANSNDVVISSLSPEPSDDKPEGFDACYARLKAEADAKFGVKDRMTVEEYFGKLRYMVNAYYDGIQNQGKERNNL